MEQKKKSKASRGARRKEKDETTRKRKQAEKIAIAEVITVEYRQHGNKEKKQQ